jgi:hypothetical protein
MHCTPFYIACILFLVIVFIPEIYQQTNFASIRRYDSSCPCTTRSPRMSLISRSIHDALMLIARQILFMNVIQEDR